MNIVEQIERIDFWLDTVASPRFDITQKENAINDAIISTVDSRYENAQKGLSQDSFQRTQKVRDQLSNLIFTPAEFLTATDPVTDGFMKRFTIFLPETTYRYLLCARAKGSQSRFYSLYPMTYDHQNVIHDNPFRRVRNDFFAKWYYNEYAKSLHVFTPITETTIDVELYYLKNPVKVRYGSIYDHSRVFVKDDVPIALSNTVYNGKTYFVGDDILINSTVFQITSGSVLFGHVNSDVNIQLHEIVCKNAALNLLLTTRETDKYKELKERMFLAT